jgi:hypothetical protein
MKDRAVNMVLLYGIMLWLIALACSCGGLPKDFGSPKHEKVIQLKEVGARIINITRTARADRKDYLVVVYFCDDKVFRSLDKELEFDGKVGDITILTTEK